MEYNEHEKTTQPIVLVGKAAFDSAESHKPAANMAEMKMDMSGRQRLSERCRPLRV